MHVEQRPLPPQQCLVKPRCRARSPDRGWDRRGDARGQTGDLIEQGRAHTELLLEVAHLDLVDDALELPKLPEPVVACNPSFPRLRAGQIPLPSGAADTHGTTLDA